MYHAMVAVEDLLELAAAQSEGSLRRYFLAHLQEEAGHAKWLRQDIGDVGTPPTLVVGMVGRQYYLIRHVSPCALLGYMVLMECFPTPMEALEKMETAHGPEMFRTLRHHAEHDPEHGQDVLRQIDALTDSEKTIVLDNAIQSARHMVLATQTF